MYMSSITATWLAFQRLALVVQSGLSNIAKLGSCGLDPQFAQSAVAHSAAEAWVKPLRLQ